MSTTSPLVNVEFELPESFGKTGSLWLVVVLLLVFVVRLLWRRLTFTPRTDLSAKFAESELKKILSEMLEKDNNRLPLIRATSPVDYDEKEE
jgi:hypothetical protein